MLQLNQCFAYDTLPHPTLLCNLSFDDLIRTCTPYSMLYKGEGLDYLTEGRNKFHATLNLKEPEGREILKGLVSPLDEAGVENAKAMVEATRQYGAFSRRQIC